MSDSPAIPVVAAAVGLALSSSLASAGDLTASLTLRPSYWRAIPSGTVKITEGGRPGSGATIDLADDLDVGAANVAEGTIEGTLGRHRAGVSYEPLDFHGETTTPRALRFHAATYAAGTRLRSDLGLRLVAPGYDYAMADVAGGEIRAGLRAYVWTFDAELRGSGAGGDVDESRRFTHVLPAVTLGGQLPFGAWTLAANSALGVLGGDRYAVDLAPELRRRVFDRWQLGIGYRWLRFRFHETTNVGDFTMHGPMVSISLDIGGPRAEASP